MHDSIIQESIGLIEPDSNEQNVVIIAVKFNRLYDVLDAQITKRQFDQKIVEHLHELKDKLLITICNIVHNSREIEGDIIEYYGDTVVICLPGEDKIVTSQNKQAQHIQIDGTEVISIKNESSKQKKKKDKEETARLKKELEEGQKKSFKRL